MEQNTFVESQNQQSGDVSSLSQPASAPVAPVSTEKMLTQSEVNSLIGRTKAEAEEKGRQRALQELKNNAPANTIPQTSPGAGINLEDIRTIAAEEAKKQQEASIQQETQKRQLEQGHKILNELMTKFESAKSKYSDFEQKVAPYFNEQTIAAFGIANQFDNTNDIAYEFANRPDTLDKITSAFKLGGPQAAYQAVAKLSESIKNNQAATNTKTPNEPLSQIKASPVGSDNGSKSVRDWMRELNKGR